MKRTAIIILLCISMIDSYTQINKGTIRYEMTGRAELQYSRGGEERTRDMTFTKPTKFVLSFDQTHSLWIQELQEDDTKGNTNVGNTKVVLSGTGSNNRIYTRFDSGKTVEQVDLFDKLFVVEDSLKKLKWNLGDESTTYLGYQCKKATAIQVSDRVVPAVINGKLEKKEIKDTAFLTAWYATGIPVPAGPYRFQGQLPGLILELDINEGRQVYTAVDISETVNAENIKEPSASKRYTAEEFKKEKEKIIKKKLN